MNVNRQLSRFVSLTFMPWTVYGGWIHVKRMDRCFSLQRLLAFLTGRQLPSAQGSRSGWRRWVDIHCSQIFCSHKYNVHIWNSLLIAIYTYIVKWYLTVVDFNSCGKYWKKGKSGVYCNTTTPHFHNTST